MTFAAKVITHSVSPQRIELLTMQLRYPKFIHGEFMTHRVFSRNASSSRAIPVERLIQDVIDDPAVPVFWGKNQPGMQAVEELSDEVDQYGRLVPEYGKYGSTMPCNIQSVRQVALISWLRAMHSAVEEARQLYKLGAHKQIVNRIIEPWCHINVVVTATEWANFDALRRHKDAQPEMRALADAMWEARQASTPMLLQPGEWHLPYITDEDRFRSIDEVGRAPEDGNRACWEWLIKLSVARCARVSYLTHEGKPPNVEDDLCLYDRLIGSVPLHASPAEHQATPDTTSGPIGHLTTPIEWSNPHEHGNFVGWRQYRKMLSSESVRDR